MRAFHLTDHSSTVPYNESPPDYYDIYPCTVLPPPVDISPPVNTPAVHTTANTGTPYATYNATGHPHVSAVVTPLCLIV